MTARRWLPALLACIAMAAPVQAAVSVLGTPTSASSSSTSSLAIARPAVSGTNVLLIAQLSVRGGSGVTFGTAPTGWTLVNRTNSGTGVALAVYRKMAANAASEPASYTFTFTSGRVAGGIIAFAGADTTTPVNTSGGQATTASALSITAPSVTPTVVNTLLVALYGVSGDGNSYSPPAGMTERLDIGSSAGPNGTRISIATQSQVAAAATGPRGATLASSSTGVGVLLALTPLAGAAPEISGAGQNCGVPDNVYVNFSERLNQASAETAANYTVTGTTVTGAALSADRQTVTLTLGSNLTSTGAVTVSNVTSETGSPIASGSSVAVSPATLYPGLVGTYFSQNGSRGASFAFTGTTATRIDAQVNFNWSQGAPGVGSTPADGFSVRWEGYLRADTTGTHAIAMGSDDGARVYLDNALVVNNWTDHGYTVNIGATRQSLSAGSFVPIRMEYFENGGFARAELRWQQPGQSGSTTYVVPAANLYNCVGAPNSLAGYTVTVASTAGSICSPNTITVRAVDSTGTAVAGFTGTVNLSTSSGTGTWAPGSGPAPAGTLVAGSNTGTATYTFAATDNGTARFTLANSLAQDVTPSVADGTYSASGSTIRFSDNAFVFAEDLSARVTGTDVAVAGRPHDMTLSLVKKDPSSGSCGVATDYTGTRQLKLWRTDVGGTYTAPTVLSPALAIPAAQPAANNLTLSFTAGVASFNLGTTDIGRYALSVVDDSLTAAATAISGGSGVLTVRPFALVVRGLQYGSTNNPGGSAATDAVFAPAGANFSAIVGAWRWSTAMLSNGADAGNTGTPSSTATQAALTAGGLAPGFASPVTLVAVAGSQTPAGGALGSLNNASLAAGLFSGGSTTTTTLQYTEVGSFQFATAGVVTDFLGSGLTLDAAVVNAAGTRNTRVGRFVPAQFSLSGAALTHRSSLGCTPASAFTHLDETFRLTYTLTAQNALGDTTANYTGTFARLDLASAAGQRLAGVDGSTVFSTGTSPARLSLGSLAGAWSNGVASGITLTAAALRGTSPDGPFNAAFGIAPVDSDGVTIGSPDLASTPGGTPDRLTVATVPLRFGRLQLSSAVGAADRALALPVSAQFWNGSAFAVNTLDSCTTVGVASMNFGNLRRTLTTADTAALGAVTLASGQARLTLAAPQGGRSGTYDVALSLGATATDASCAQPWTPGSGDAATAGANLAYLRGAWCGTASDKDPAARATFGLQRGNEAQIYRRENY